VDEARFRQGYALGAVRLRQGYGGRSKITYFAASQQKQFT